MFAFGKVPSVTHNYGLNWVLQVKGFFLQGTCLLNRPATTTKMRMTR